MYLYIVYLPLSNLYGLTFQGNTKQRHLSFPDWVLRFTNVSHLLVTFASSANFYIYFAKYGRRPSFNYFNESRRGDRSQQQQQQMNSPQLPTEQQHQRRGRPRLESVESREVESREVESREVESREVPPTEAMSGSNAFSNFSNQSSIRRKVVIVSNGKKLNKFSVKQKKSQVVSNENEVQAEEESVAKCTCNLGSIIVHQTDVHNEKGT